MSVNEESCDDKSYDIPVNCHDDEELEDDSASKIFHLEQQMIDIWSRKIANVQKFSQDLEQISNKVKLQEETISSLTATISTQSLTIMQMEVENKKLKEKVSSLIYKENVYHLEKQMLGLTPCNCELSSTVGHVQATENAKHVEEVAMSENQKDRDIVITDRYIAQPHTNFTVQKEAEIDFKNKAWISKMLEATQKLVKKYAIPCHLRDEVEAKQKNKRPPIVPKAFTSLWRNLLSFVNLPKSVPVPDSTPSIDWSQVKFKPSLPLPVDFPVHSVSMDPKFYMDTVFNAGSSCRQDAEFLK